MFTERFQKKLALQQQSGLYRDPPVIIERRGRVVQIGNREMLNFSSNDYLGLGSSPRVAAIVAEKFLQYGASSGSSRLVSGNYQVIKEAEQAFAEAFGYEDALFYPSGYQANIGLIGTLFEAGDQIFFDKHVHASTVKGIQMSGASFKGYNHNDLSHLEKRLGASSATHPAVLTESLFSMDGDFLDVAALLKRKQTHRFFCVVDEAHSVGVCGEKGFGTAWPVADIALGTLGKAFGLFGAFVLLPTVMKAYLLNFSAPQIYSTTLPEAHAAAAREILEMVRQGDDLRQQLRKNSTRMKQKLTENGFQVTGDAHILAVTIGSEQAAVNLSKRMMHKKLLVFPARFPTVPLGKAILRISMSAVHTPGDVDYFVKQLVAETKEGEP